MYAVTMNIPIGLADDLKKSHQNIRDCIVKMSAERSEHFVLLEALSGIIDIDSPVECFKVFLDNLRRHSGELLLFVDCDLGLPDEYLTELRDAYAIPTHIAKSALAGVVVCVEAWRRSAINPLTILLSTGAANWPEETYLTEIFQTLKSKEPARVVRYARARHAAKFRGEFKEAWEAFGHGVDLFLEALPGDPLAGESWLSPEHFIEELTKLRGLHPSTSDEKALVRDLLRRYLRLSDKVFDAHFGAGEGILDDNVLWALKSMLGS